MRADERDESRLAGAREYLSEYLADVNIHGGEAQMWFRQLGAHVMQLPLNQEVIAKAAVNLQPFLDGDERVEGTMYPAGEAVQFIRRDWGGDFRQYFAAFVDAMGRDHTRWQTIIDTAEIPRWALERQSPLELSRGYLAEYLADEDFHGSESQIWFRQLSAYVTQLPVYHEAIAKAASYLQPFLDDDERVECAMYPAGEAVQFIERDWGGDFREYFAGFVDAMGRDHARWVAHVAARGANAEWTLQKGPPKVGVRQGLFETTPTTVPSRYESWEHFLAATTPAERRTMCATRARKANAPRLYSRAPERQLTADDVWQIVEAARGRCHYCDSLCLEKLPYDPQTKKKLPWADIGRRIGSLNHITPRVLGGTNEPENLAWSCLWCNTWTSERTAGAVDHGGLQPPGS